MGETKLVRGCQEDPVVQIPQKTDSLGMKVGADHRADPSEDLRGGGQAEAEDPELQYSAFPDEPEVPGRVRVDGHLEVRVLQIQSDHVIPPSDGLEHRF